MNSARWSRKTDRAEQSLAKFAWLRRRLATQMFHENERCPECGHDASEAISNNWGWLAAMNGMLPAEFTCDHKLPNGAACGCRNELHLRY